MLRDLQTYIAQRGTVSLADLSLHFHVDSQAIQPMLTKLSRKGRIRQLPQPSKCCGCTACDGMTLEQYSWVDPGQP
ncbi:MAG: FeoC-like transcriptional regulator [Leptolyngbya sp.]|nr:FeoC-like transcriptional regulator [Leptolyngbya sp.]